MKSNRLFILLTAALGLVAGSASGRAENQKPAEAARSPANVGASVRVPSNRPPAAPSNVRISVMVTPGFALATWSDIAGHSCDKREAFLAGLNRLEARVDEQMRDLRARRALLKRPADIKHWDLEMTEMENGRAQLKAMGGELRQATPETWQQQKDRVGLAWARTQDAYQRVLFSMMG